MYDRLLAVSFSWYSVAVVCWASDEGRQGNVIEFVLLETVTNVMLLIFREN